MLDKDVYKRAGGKRQGIVRIKPDEEIPAIYSSDPAVRRAYNSMVNNVHINRSRCSK